MLDKLFGRHFRTGHRPPAPSDAPLPHLRETPRLRTISRRAYETFLNLHIQYLFDERALAEESRKAFYALAMEIAAVLEYEDPPPPNIELHATAIAEEMQRKARRQSVSLQQLIQEVLVDQRNHLLARHINERARKMGMGDRFSGIDTACGSPRKAFVYKLLADSSLGRGPASGLDSDTVHAVSEELKARAASDVQAFLERYYREHEA